MWRRRDLIEASHSVREQTGHIATNELRHCLTQIQIKSNQIKERINQKREREMKRGRQKEEDLELIEAQLNLVVLKWEELERP